VVKNHKDKKELVEQEQEQLEALFGEVVGLLLQQRLEITLKKLIKKCIELQ